MCNLFVGLFHMLSCRCICQVTFSDILGVVHKCLFIMIWQKCSFGDLLLNIYLKANLICLKTWPLGDVANFPYVPM